jgi:AcrR family transcriptional regulator
MAENSIDHPGTTRRDRRILRQRQDIMDAAASLFAANGYAATTTKDIAAAVDIGESTLYGYFPGKQEILMAIFGEQSKQVDAILASISSLDDYQSYVSFVDLLMETLLSKVDYTRALIGEAWINDRVLNEYVMTRARILTQYLEAFIASRIENGDFRPVEPRLTARIIIATFIGALLPVLRGVQPPPDPLQRKALAEAVVKMISDGIAVHPGRQDLT